VISGYDACFLKSGKYQGNALRLQVLNVKRLCND
jgi:hypothetical protein